ncbi:MAG TPA: LptF/LptG family permease, partial [Opitutaceae bacterium]|nr:LptF/LptG family permease [Opitutaceae bacterium]
MLIAMLGLVLVQVVYGDLRDLLAAGAGLMDVAVYVFVSMPSYLSLLLPLSLLISLLYALGQFHRNHEFTALRAAGMGLRRITAPIWGVGVLCCILSGWLNASVIPWSVEESRALLERLQFSRQAQTQPTDRIGAVTSVAFDNREGGRMWFFNRFSR